MLEVLPKSERRDLFDPIRIEEDIQAILDSNEFWFTPTYSLTLQAKFLLQENVLSAVTPDQLIKQLSDYGLDVSASGRHWKVRDPTTGAWLFDVSKTPSDHNWYWQVRRHLRRLGLISKEISELDRREKQNKRQITRIDLDALKRAQDAAAAAGERIPQLSDLELSVDTSVIRNREGEEEMPKEKAPEARVNVTRKRLTELLVTRGNELEAARKARLRADGAKFFGRESPIAQIAYLAHNVVAPKHNLTRWKNEQNTTQAIGKFNRDAGDLEIWGFNLLEATMDYIEDEPLTVSPVEPATEPESEPEKPKREYTRSSGNSKPVEPEPTPAPVPSNNNTTDEIRLRYASALLTMLERNAIHGDNVETILVRLDRLVGLES